MLTLFLAMAVTTQPPSPQQPVYSQSQPQVVYAVQPVYETPAPKTQRRHTLEFRLPRFEWGAIRFRRQDEVVVQAPEQPRLVQSPQVQWQTQAVILQPVQAAPSVMAVPVQSTPPPSPAKAAPQQAFGDMPQPNKGAPDVAANEGLFKILQTIRDEQVRQAEAIRKIQERTLTLTPHPKSDQVSPFDDETNLPQIPLPRRSAPILPPPTDWRTEDRNGDPL